eukprot:2061058-Rhodomonas_salina.1
MRAAAPACPSPRQSATGNLKPDPRRHHDPSHDPSLPIMMAWHDYNGLRTVGLSRHFGVELGEKLLHERVPLLCHLPGVQKQGSGPGKEKRASA